jgi:hypothetical protein
MIENISTIVTRGGSRDAVVAGKAVYKYSRSARVPGYELNRMC